MSEAARIRRGSAAARPRSRAVAKPKAAVRGAQSKATSLVSLLPISARTSARIVRWGAGLIVAALLVALMTAFQLPQMAGRAAGEAIGSAGFSVKRVLTPGVTGEHELALQSIAANQESTAMPLIDLNAIRDQAMQIGWVADARVSRRLPDTIVIDVTQRTPAAIWQNRGKLVLIDADGVVLDDVALDRMPDLPLVIGPAANTQAAALTKLLDRVPNVEPMLAGATWIGGRRWDVRFQSGEVLALPEGEAAATRALTKFARMDSTYGLLGKGYVRLDMRDARKMYVRVSSEPGKRVQLGADKVI